MKKLLILLLLALLNSITIQAQGKCTYTITVLNNQGKKIGNIPVILIETTAKNRISKNTNSQGVVTFELTYGKEWAVNILEMKKCDVIEVPENGSAEGSTQIMYDVEHYNRIHRDPVDRSKLKLIVENQINFGKRKYTDKEALIILNIIKEDDSNLNGFPVNLTCYKLGKTYLGKTNNLGIAYFLVPNKNDYEVDIEGIESFDFVDIKQSAEYSSQITYQPTTVKEVVKNDTITQYIPKEPKGTSARVALKIKVSKVGTAKLANEDVYLQMLKTNKVYKSKTNAEGVAYFMLPKKHKYMLQFKYQRDIDVLNFSEEDEGISTAEAVFEYEPDPKLQFPEKYIPKPKDLFIKEFSEFVTKQFPEPVAPNKIGLNVTWGNENVNNDSKEAVLQLGFSSKNSTSISGPPINISLVIDKSGSMDGYDRMDALKTTLLNFVQKLRKTDIVSIVTFNDESVVLVPAQAVGDGKYLKDMIEDLSAGGGTNIYKGMVNGYEQILKSFILKGTNKVVLLTDGYGSDDPITTINKSKEYNAKGIELTAIGVGKDYNQALLSQLASNGGGLYHYVGDSKDIHNVFCEKILGALYPTVKDLKIEITYNEKIKLSQLYGYKFSNTAKDKAVFKIADAYPGLNTLALVKFDLNKPERSIENQPIIIKMSYFDYEKKSYVEQEEKAYLKWSEASGKLELILETQQKKLYSIAILNQSIKVMSEAFEAENYKLALTTIENTLSRIKEIYPNCKDDEDIKNLINELSNYAMALSKIRQQKK